MICLRYVISIIVDVSVDQREAFSGLPGRETMNRCDWDNAHGAPSPWCPPSSPPPHGVPARAPRSVLSHTVVDAQHAATSGGGNGETRGGGGAGDCIWCRGPTHQRSQKTGKAARGVEVPLNQHVKRHASLAANVPGRWEQRPLSLCSESRCTEKEGGNETPAPDSAMPRISSSALLQHHPVGHLQGPRECPANAAQHRPET